MRVRARFPGRFGAKVVKMEALAVALYFSRRRHRADDGTVLHDLKHSSGLPHQNRVTKTGRITARYCSYL